MSDKEVEIYDYSDILHMHCQSCYQAVCSEQENCVMARCLYCAVSLHGCKIDDHEEICLMVQVACPNAGYGCPSRIVRGDLAKHLGTCPASVVHCGMEWNRYPLYSRERYTLTNIYSSQEGRIKQKREHWVPFSLINPPKIKGQLDLEFAISDQRKLVKEKQKKMAIGKWKLSKGSRASRIPQDRIERLADLLGGRVCQKADSSDRYRDRAPCGLPELIPFDKLSVEESSSNSGFCTNQPTTENKDSKIKGCGEERNLPIGDRQDSLQCSAPNRTELMMLASLKREKFDSETGECVAEERKKKETAAHCQHKVETHVEMSRSKSICEAGQPVVDSREEKELVYQVQVLAEDFHTEEEAVEIWNPGVTGVPRVPAQIHEQLKNASTDHLGLNVVIETIPKFQKNYPMYSIPCDVDVRRDQYCSHFKNIHDDIHGGLNHWIQQRCPLAQYGCPYIRHRFTPNSQGGLLVFDHEIDNFGVISGSALDKMVCDTTQDHCFELLSLPLELLEKIALFLDSYSLNQLSKACRTTHEVCMSLLQRRGIVIFEWERGYYSNGAVMWKIRRKKWLFSPAFSKVSSWHFTEEPAMGQHLRSCPFFNVFIHRKPIPLPIADFSSVKLNHEWRWGRQPDIISNSS